MATILENITRVHTGFVDDEAKQDELLLILKTHAVKAILKGIESDEAKKYMSMFADNERQLNLLTNPEVVPDMPWLSEVQAYLMANSVCAPSTNGQTGNGIFDEPGAAGLSAFDAEPNVVSGASVVGLRPAEFDPLFQ